MNCDVNFGYDITVVKVKTMPVKIKQRRDKPKSDKIIGELVPSLVALNRPRRKNNRA